MKKDLKNVSITFALVAATFFGGAALNSRSVLAQNASGSIDAKQATEAAALKLKEERIAEINAQQELLLKEQSKGATSRVTVAPVKTATTTASSQKTASPSTPSQNVTPVVDTQAAARLKAQQDYIAQLQAAQQQAAQDARAQQLAAQQAAAEQAAQQSMMYSRSRMSRAS